MKTLLLSALFLTTAAQAGVFKLDMSRFEEARKQNLISSETLIVKVKKGSNFSERSKYLGEFRPFFEAADGTWGYLKLNMTPDALNASFVLKDLSVDEDIVHAYYAPLAKPATVNEPAPAEEEAELLVETPDFESRQNYLQEAPTGVGAIRAWMEPGGTGKNVKVIDIETCFEDRHEDFNSPFWIGSNPESCISTDHGTAVWGEIAAKRDGKGVTGIAHEADYGIYGFAEGDWEDVNDQYIEKINIGIQGAIKHLDAGDVMVIEQQMVGPDLKKYTAVEYWPHIYDQLKAATDRGIICVEAAGNGNSNFDDPSYDGAFDLSKRDSGCIMVGAVDPHSKERLSFSNYGSRLDVAAYGRGVVTTGYGDLFNASRQRSYTARFSGTSSATPIVAGTVAVVSSIAKENRLMIAPKAMRAALRATGVKQGSDTSKERVGNFPVISQLLLKLRVK
jgi:subtilisin family serine protease